MTFQIENFTDALIRGVNPRAEMHGNDPVPAADISVRIVVPNTFLDLLSPVLRTMLYKPADGSSAQQDLAGVEAISDTPMLRSDMLEQPIRLKTEVVGRNLEIDYGTGGKSNIVLPTCNVNEFKANCMDGGSVELGFRIQASGINEKTMGKLATLIRHEVKLRLTVSEEASAQASLIDTGAPPALPAAKKAPAKKGDAPVKEAGQAFAKAYSEGKTTPAKTAAKKTPLAKKIARATKAPARKAGKK